MTPPRDSTPPLPALSHRAPPRSALATLAAALLLVACDGGSGGSAGAQEPGGQRAEAQEIAARDVAARQGSARGAGSGERSLACEVMAHSLPLPGVVRETSGLARSGRDGDLFWTHNDAGGAPVLFGVTGRGEPVQAVGVVGAALVDWEDVEVAPCGAGSCVYVADTGDNDGARAGITVYVVPEPGAGVDRVAAAQARHARYPDGPRDAEGLFVLGGDVYVVTKGRHGAIELYRLPPGPAAASGNAKANANAAAPGAVVTLEYVRQLFPQPADGRDRVTAATATPDGKWVALRTYRTLLVYRAAALVSGAPLEPLQADLGMLGEPQGEGLAMGNDGAVWVTSEAEGGGAVPRMAHLRCRLPES